MGVVAGAALVFAFAVRGFANSPPVVAFACEDGTVLATGDPDPAVFSVEASKGVRAFWCERYDEFGMATRVGSYWEIDASGQPRTEAGYVDSRLAGPVTVRNEDGGLFVRGFLENGEWSGRLEIFHENGVPWLEADFVAGQLEGDLRTRFSNGALESETHYQRGYEDGLARSFYPTAVGGRLKSEAHVEADQIVGRHRVLNPEGRLIRSIDWNSGPAEWASGGSGPPGLDVHPASLGDSVDSSRLDD